MRLLATFIFAVFSSVSVATSAEDISLSTAVATQSFECDGHLYHDASSANRAMDQYIDRSGTDVNATCNLEPHQALYRRADPVTRTLKLSTTLSGYYVKISVGQKPFLTLLDTGSSDFWLMSKKGPRRRYRDVAYDPRSAKPLLFPGTKSQIGFRITYLDDALGDTTMGFIFLDGVSLAGLNVPEVAVGAANTWGASFGPQFEADGVLGLGFPALSSSQQPPLLYTLLDHNALEHVFSLKLVDRLWASEMEDESEIMFGGANPDHYEAPFTYVDVNSDVYWQVPVDAFSVNGQPAIGPVSAIIDTGGSLIIGDLENVQKIHDAIPSAEMDPNPSAEGWVVFKFPCDSKFVVSLTFNGTPFDMTADQLAVEQYVNSDDCQSAIVAFPRPRAGISWIVGTQFLSTVYTTFKATAPAQIGFAKLKPTRWRSGRGPHVDYPSDDDEA